MPRNDAGLGLACVLQPMDTTNVEPHIAGPTRLRGGTAMLGYAIAFFIVALVAAFFGFGSIAAGAAGIAKILFFIFLALAIVSLVSGMMRGGRRSVL